MSELLQASASIDDTLSVKRKALLGSIHTGVGQFLRIFVSLASQLVLSRLLSPADFGLIAMTGVFMAFIEMFSNLGMSQAVVQKENITQTELNSLYWVGILASATCMFVLMGASPFVAMIYQEPRVQSIMMVTAIQLPISAAAGHASALMARQMRFAAIATVDLISVLCVFIVSAASAFLGASYWALVTGSMVGVIVRALLERWLSGWRPSRPQWSREALPVLRFGRDMTAFSMLTFMSTYLDNFLIGAFRSAEDVGFFDRSFTLVIRPLGSLTAPIGRVAVPLLSRLYNHKAHYRQSFFMLFDGMQIILIPGLVVAVMVSHDVVLVLLGAKWVSIAPMFSAISVAAMFVPLSSAGIWLLTSQARISEQVQAAFVSSGSVIVSLLIGLHWGIVGVAIAYAVFAPVVHGIYTFAAARKGPVNIIDIAKGCLPGIAISCVGFPVVAIMRDLTLTPFVRCAVCASMSYVVALAVVLLIPRTRKSGVKILRSLWRQKD